MGNPFKGGQAATEGTPHELPTTSEMPTPPDKVVEPEAGVKVEAPNPKQEKQEEEEQGELVLTLHLPADLWGVVGAASIELELAAAKTQLGSRVVNIVDWWKAHVVEVLREEHAEEIATRAVAKDGGASDAQIDYLTTLLKNAGEAELTQEELTTLRGPGGKQKAGAAIKKLKGEAQPEEGPICPIHNIAMKKRQGKQGVFFSHSRHTPQGKWEYCSGSGYPSEKKAETPREPRF